MKKYKSKTDYTTIECNREVSHKITHILKTKKQGIKKRYFITSLLIAGLKAKKLM